MTEGSGGSHGARPLFPLGCPPSYLVLLCGCLRHPFWVVSQHCVLSSEALLSCPPSTSVCVILELCEGKDHICLLHYCVPSPSKWKALSKHSTKEAGNKQGQEKERGGRALIFFRGGSPAGRLLRVQPCPEAQEGNLGDKMLI